LIPKLKGKGLSRFRREISHETINGSYHKMLAMDNRREEIKTIRERLRSLDAEFDREMRARGFDPAQAENVALPAHLAALYAERDQIKAELEESEGKTDD